MVAELGRIPTTDASYTDVSPYPNTAQNCENCVAYTESGSCAWVAVTPDDDGWCKFNVVPVVIRATAQANSAYDELSKNSPSVDGVHVPAVGAMVGGRKRRKTVPANMEVLDEVNPDVMQDANLLQKSAEDDSTIGSISKNAELRYTLGPWYVPNSQDAHGEWTDTQELQKALWGYVENGDRDIRLQHNVNVVAGKWVEAMTWPHPVDVPMLQADTGAIRKTTFPAGTVFLGVQWEPWAWDLVKKGKIRGYSIGGTGAGVEVDLPTEYDNPPTFLNGDN
jgi:hypothetical protein